MKKKRRFGLRTKIVSAILAMTLLFSLGAGGVTYAYFHNATVNDYKRLEYSVAVDTAYNFPYSFNLTEEGLVGDPLSNFSTQYFLHAPKDKSIEEMTKEERAEYASYFNFLYDTTLYTGYVSSLKTFANSSALVSVSVVLYDDTTNRLVYFAEGHIGDGSGYFAGYYKTCPEAFSSSFQAQQAFQWGGFAEPRDGYSFATGHPIKIKDEVRGYVFTYISNAQLHSVCFNFAFPVIALTVGLSILLAVVLLLILNRYFLKPIKTLSGLAEVTAESMRTGQGVPDLTAPKVKAIDEMADLYSSFDFMKESLREYIDNLAKATATQEKAKAELEIAAKIQSVMLSDPNFYDNGVEIACFMEPAKEIGGDFYDYFPLSDGRIAILVADVSGKGIPAAIVMAKAMEMIREKAKHVEDVSTLFEEVNDTLLEEDPDGLFVTCFLAVLDKKKGSMHCVCAGHEPAYILRGRQVVPIDCPHNFVLGGLKGSKFPSFEMKVKPGDHLLIYTDGLSEATNARKQLFGKMRIQREFAASRELTAQGVVEKLHKAALDFVDGAPQSDDMTIVSVYLGDDSSIKGEADDATLAKLQGELKTKLKEAGAGDKESAEVSIIVDELFSNVKKYAYGEGKEKPIEISYLIHADFLYMSFSDFGIPFNPLLAQSNLSLETEGGLGIHIVKRISNGVAYIRDKNRNIVAVAKKIKENADAPAGAGI